MYAPVASLSSLSPPAQYSIVQYSTVQYNSLTSTLPFSLPACRAGALSSLWRGLAGPHGLSLV